MLGTSLALAEIVPEKENSPREFSWMFNVSKHTNDEMFSLYSIHSMQTLLMWLKWCWRRSQ